MAKRASVPESVEISTRDIESQLTKRLSDTDEDVAAYVLRLVKEDLGVSIQSPSTHGTIDGRRKVWRTIAATADAYEVSNHGQVRRKGTKRNLTVRMTKRRAAIIHLQVDKKAKTFLVRRLVAEAFLGPVPQGWWVMHINEKSENCKLSNLEVVPPAEGVKKVAEQNRRRASKARRARSS